MEFGRNPPLGSNEILRGTKIRLLLDSINQLPEFPFWFICMHKQIPSAKVGPKLHNKSWSTDFAGKVRERSA